MFNTKSRQPTLLTILDWVLEPLDVSAISIANLWHMRQVCVIGAHIEVTWNGNSIQLPIVRKFVSGLLVCTIGYKFCG
jgi:hypothetical protein